ncbi:hypothetical protein BDY21DRAFT_269153, partial [Lineolata rhizophorae]
MTPPGIPAIYRSLLLWIDPALAFGTALVCHFAPGTYLAGVTARAAGTAFDPVHQAVYTQLAGNYILAGVVETVALRVTSEPAVWRAVAGAIVACDCVFVWSGRSAMGPDVFAKPARWRAEDWGGMGMLIAGIVIRSALALGVGLGKAK